MKRLLFGLALLIFLAPSAWAATCAFSSDGLWTTGTACAPPTIADTCTIAAGKTVWCNASTCACGNLTISGQLLMRPGTRTLKIGNQTAAASNDFLTIASTGALIGGPSHTLEWNLARAGANEATKGVLTNNGRLVWKGRQLFTGGKITSVAAITGNAPSRTVTLTDSGYTQRSNDYWSGKYLVPTSGYFRHHFFEITTGGANGNEIVVKMDNRGALDTRNVAGNVDPVAWAPGDKGPTLPYDNATCTGATAPWPCCSGAGAGTCTATVANGGRVVTFGAAVFAYRTSLCTAASTPFPCCTGSGTGTCTSDSNIAGDLAPGARFACAADVNAANDADFRRICYVNSATSVTLCQDYGTASCAAGAAFRIYVDNQPPYAVVLDETFKAGDTYEIIEPAKMTLTSGQESDANPNNQYNIVLNSGSATDLSDILLDYCGFDGTTAGDNDCLDVIEIDNDNTAEQFTIARADIWHFTGEAAINLDGSDNIVIDRVNIHDAAEGGVQDNHEAHGILFNKSTTLSSNITVKRSRITRTNDAPIGISGGLGSERGAADSVVEDTFIGFVPANFGGSTSFASTFPLDDFRVSRVFMTNTSGISFLTTSASAVSRATINGSLFFNLKNTTPPIQGGGGSSTDLAHASNLVYFTGNAVVGSSGGFLRGYVLDNFVAPLNPALSNGQGAILQPQKAQGNVVLGAPYAGSNFGDIHHEPTSATISGLSPAIVTVQDNAVYTHTTQTVNASCTASLNPWPCCSGAGAGTCNSALHFAIRGRSDSGGSTTNYLMDHDAVVANDRYSSASQYGIGVTPAGSTSSVTNSIVLDAERAVYQVAAGGGNITCGYNLTMASTVDYTNGDAATCAVPGNNNLNTGQISLARAELGDMSSSAGSTAFSSLGSDGTVRGVRVAGPPNPKAFLRLYSSPILLDAAGRAPGDASFAAGLIPIEITNTNTTGDTDADGDGVWNTHDNCDVTWNPNQEDPDGDGKGCACDAGETCS